MRGFLTTPIERAVSAISGVDYVESTSRAGVSTVRIRLRLNHSSTAALAEVNARLQQVRAELPVEAEPPVVDLLRTDRPYASFYISFTSSERSVPALTDWLMRTLQPQLSTLEGIQRVTFEGDRQIAMRVWIDPDQLAALNLTRVTCTPHCSETIIFLRSARPRATWCRLICSPTPTCVRWRSSPI